MKRLSVISNNNVSLSNWMGSDVDFSKLMKLSRDSPGLMSGPVKANPHTIAPPHIPEEKPQVSESHTLGRLEPRLIVLQLERQFHNFKGISIQSRHSTFQYIIS